MTQRQRKTKIPLRRQLLVNYAGYLVALTAFIGALYSPLMRQIESHLVLKLVAVCLFGCVYLGSLGVILFRVFTFNRYIQSIHSLLLLYFEMLFVFASIYLWLYLIGGAEQISGFAEFNRAVALQADHAGNDLYYRQIWKLIADAIHFSVVTGTTLGYGDMVPKHAFAKLIVDSQVLLTAGIVVIGYGKYAAVDTKKNEAS